MFDMITLSSSSNSIYSPRNSLNPSRTSSRVRMPSWLVSNCLKIVRSLSSFCLEFMLLAIYAMTAYCSLRSQWKFLREVSALTHSGFTVIGEPPPRLFAPWVPARWNCLIHGSPSACPAVIRFAGSFWSISLIRSLAALLTELHSLPINGQCIIIN